MDFEAISWLAVVLAAAAFFAIGGLWYGALFGKLWMRLSGMTEEQAAGSNLPLIFGATLVLELVAAAGLAAWIGADATLADGLCAGALVSLLFVVPVLGVQALYDRKPPVLWALNAGYNVVGFLLMGAIIGALQ